MTFITKKRKESFELITTKKRFTTRTLALSTSFDFRFLIFGDSSKKRSDPGARPRPSIGVSGASFWAGGAEVLVQREWLRLISFSCAFRSSEADIVGFLSSSGFSEKEKNKISVIYLPNTAHRISLAPNKL